MAIDPNKNIDHYEAEVISFVKVYMTDSEYEEYLESISESNNEEDEP